MKSVLIAGGTGTYGRAFIPLALQRYDRIAVYSRDENKQFWLRRELGDDPRLRWFIGDVRDKDRLRRALEGIDHVVHAAALKHVPSGEYNPGEHVKTNVFGAQNLLEAAIDAGVSKAIAISSDKAVEPINLYGATKLCMERLFLAYNALAAGRSHFSCVRYGNVVGSRGSFLEILKSLRASGAKTYPLRSVSSTRFWLAAEDAALFVLDRLKDMQGTEIFVPKLSASTAGDFAKEHFPEGVPEIVGIPPGEKEHETLISEAESSYVEEEEDYFVIRPLGPRLGGLPWRYTSNGALRFHRGESAFAFLGRAGA